MTCRLGSANVCEVAIAASAIRRRRAPVERLAADRRRGRRVRRRRVHPNAAPFSSSWIDGSATSTTTTSGRSVSNARTSSSASSASTSGPMATTAGSVRVSSATIDDCDRRRADRPASTGDARSAGRRRRRRPCRPNCSDGLATRRPLISSLPGSAASQTVAVVDRGDHALEVGLRQRQGHEELAGRRVGDLLLLVGVLPVARRRSARSSRARCGR